MYTDRYNSLMHHYTLAELQALPTLATSQADDLKVDTFIRTIGREVRVWLSRATIEDGEPYNNRVTIEKYNGSNWEVWKEYPAR